MDSGKMGLKMEEEFIDFKMGISMTENGKTIGSKEKGYLQRKGKDHIKEISKMDFLKEREFTPTTVKIGMMDNS